jgi:peptidoglycan/xylan/chitin deacetylase (PgdA/CDA1 family)
MKLAMRRLYAVLAMLFITSAAFSQSMQPMGKTTGHVPPLPRDGAGQQGVITPILIYHAIRPYIPTDTAGVRRYIATPQTLEAELAFLKAGGFTSVTPDDMERSLTGGAPLPPRPVILTFDDNWEGQYTYALPLLKKYGFTATFYTWVVVVGRAHHMSWDEVKALADAGMQIGCHTMTHPYLTQVSGDAEMRWQIFTAKKTIEEHIGRPVTTFAYPFGQYNERVVSFVKEAGFTSARSTWPGIVHDAAGLFSLTGLIRTESAPSLEQTLASELKAAELLENREANAEMGLTSLENPVP